MKVFVFFHNEVTNGETISSDVKLFSDRNEAYQAFRKWQDVELRFAQENNYIVDDNREDSFEAFLEGYYMTDHTTGWVKEQDVL